MADRPNRRTIRMRGYDYASEGAYFLTICTDEMRHLFGRVENGVVITNALGDIAQQCWDAPQHMPHVDIGEFVVMPNHVHGIVVIRERLVAPDGKTLDGGAAGADHDRPALPPTTDNDTTGTPLGPDTPEPPEIPDGTGPLDDTERPLAMDDGLDDGHVDDVTGAPGAQCRADHDRPLRPPADPDAPPPTTPGNRRPMPTVPVGSLGRIVRAYKSAVTRIAYRDGVLPRGTTLWQRNYWDDIIWDHASYERITRYIRDNPANWRKDDFHG